MSIPSVSAMNAAIPAARMPERAERPGQEHDSDADDKTVKPQVTQSPVTGGAGGIVNTKA